MPGDFSNRSGLLRALQTSFAIHVVRHYIKHELPGWGRLYHAFVGTFEHDRLWQDQPVRYVVGKLHGYKMGLRIGGWSNRATFFLRRFYDLPTQLLFCRFIKPGQIVVDVGANEGMISLVASRLVGSTGKVIAFEPNPVPGDILRQHIETNGITQIEFHAMGVSDMAGTLDLFVPYVNTGEGTFTVLTHVEGDVIQCPVVVGDSVIGSRHVDLIKIDVEGYEMRVLRGLCRAISESHPIIVMEMVAEHLARDGVTPEDVVAYLQSAGYVGRRISSKRMLLKRVLIMSAIPAAWYDGDYVWLPKKITPGDNPSLIWSQTNQSLR